MCFSLNLLLEAPNKREVLPEISDHVDKFEPTLLGDINVFVHFVAHSSARRKFQANVTESVPDYLNLCGLRRR
jgi:hypothetical protein